MFNLLKKDMSFSYKIFDATLLDQLGLSQVFETSSLETNCSMRNYSKFKLIQIDEIILLRFKLQQDKVNDGIWSESILRFLEVRINRINELLKLNYTRAKEREAFKEELISFLLESHYYSNDFRFLNTAIKLNQKVTNIRADQRLYNTKLLKFLMNRI